MSYKKIPTHQIFAELVYAKNAEHYCSLQFELESRDPYLEIEQYIGQSDDNEPIFVPIEYEEIIIYDENGEPII